MQLHVLEQGQEALIYHYNGRVSHKTGPKRLWLFLSRIKVLDKYAAKHDEYLKISHVDGKVEHRMGPSSCFLNPLKYESIKVLKCYCLNANQAIIVYKKSESEKSPFKSEITFGPGIFMIQPDEWVHNFCWHGVDDENKTRYVANKNKFEMLNCAPDQLYYNVDEVRTSDDALIRIKLMIFYELKDIELMLKETKDPIADFINCCRTDVISFTIQRTYLSFIENCNLLNNLEEYPVLVERSKNIGFEITKVVFRGYFASPKLQQMHDSSIEKRTDLKLKFESELQHQQQLETNLKNQMERVKTEKELEYSKLTNKHLIEKLNLENELNTKWLEAQKTNESEMNLKLKDLEMISKKNEQTIEHLKNLKSMGIDLDNYLKSTLTVPNKSVKIVNNSSPRGSFNDAPNSTQPNIHFHD